MSRRDDAVRAPNCAQNPCKTFLRRCVAAENAIYIFARQLPGLESFASATGTWAIVKLDSHWRSPTRTAAVDESSVESGRVGSGRVESGRVGSSRVESGRVERKSPDCSLIRRTAIAAVWMELYAARGTRASRPRCWFELRADFTAPAISSGICWKISRVEQFLRREISSFKVTRFICGSFRNACGSCHLRNTKV